ncbi:alternative ribosome rescue aminoacyl-tRNA hydrolase ArfB [Cyclobacterium sp.]|uniref:alternative ribosome rescue aminoacyl-tRNA hydrolase ArfB n=1 Tax=Cyclobacterium sp. TaxID=1966343 RepID=UPI0019904290|nr:alternative ribosome rescue aminoacyl-tRNA hydrolase ArfB [Cyclobacterium sp.]MBD3627293.1 aminoacyl-tRNA hydrolase [Cyclobacterium sp.]
MSIFHKIKEQFLNQELSFQAARSSGPGGQNVNKVNSKIILRFNIPDSQLLDESEKDILMKKWAHKLDNTGDLIIQTQEKRSQLQNKSIAIRKFYEMLNAAFQKRKVRKATRPGKGAIEKRIKAKKIQAEKKKYRGKDW